MYRFNNLAFIHTAAVTKHILLQAVEDRLSRLYNDSNAVQVSIVHRFDRDRAARIEKCLVFRDMLIHLYYLRKIKQICEKEESNIL